MDYSPEESVAVLLGSSRFPRDPENLPGLPAVTANLVDFERLLRDPSVVGLPPGSVHRLLDEDDLATVSENLAVWCGDAHDLLIFYYAGHGLIDSGGDLLLTLQRSTFANAEANCLRWRDVKSFILKSRAKRKLIILDCCFSGRADTMGAADQLVPARMEVKGTVVLMSSPRNEPSLSEPEERRTAFTDALLSTIEEGVDNGRSIVSVNELFANTTRVLLARNAPEPQRVATGDANDIALVLNRQSQLSKEAYSFQHVVRQIEARVNAFLDARLQEEKQHLPELDEPPPLTPTRQILRIMIAGPLSLLVVGEIAWIYNLGLGKRVYTESGGRTIEYPNLLPFLLTLATLLILSIGVAVFAAASLRSPATAVLARAFGLNKWSIRFVFIAAVINAVVIALTALLTLSFSVLASY